MFAARFAFVLIATSLFFSTGTLIAQTDVTWTGGNGDFDDGTKWSGGVVPNGVGDNAIIDDDASVDSTVQAVGALIGSLTVDSGDSLIIDGTDQITILNDSVINANSGTIHNNGTISISSRNGNNLSIDTELTLTGSGTIQIDGTGELNSILGVGHIGRVFKSPHAHLVNDGNTIQGSGGIGGLGSNGRIAITNRAGGVIDANVAGPQTEFGHALGLIAIDSSTVVGTIFNHGLLRASNSGTLLLAASALENTGGIVEAIEGAWVTNEALGFPVNISGGTLRTETGGRIDLIAGELSDMTIDGTARFTSDALSLTNLDTNGTINIFADETTITGQINNQGLLNFEAEGGVIVLDSAVTFSGGGLLRLNNDRGVTELIEGTIVDPTGASGHLINSNHSIKGNGAIGSLSAFAGLRITNDSGGVIDANVMVPNDPTSEPFDHALTLTALDKGIVNRGVIRASNGGMLLIWANNIQNTGGTIEAVQGATVSNDVVGGPVSISGGMLRTDTGGSISMIQVESLTDMTIDGDVQISSDDLTVSNLVTDGNVRIVSEFTSIDGDIENRGSLSFEPSESIPNRVGQIEIDNTVTFSGGGVLRINDDENIASLIEGTIIDSGTNGHLINVNHTIEGNGAVGGIASSASFGLRITNGPGGLIEANVAVPTDAEPFEHSLALTALDKGIVNMGTIRASNGGLLFLWSEQIDNAGGIIEAVEGARISNEAVIGSFILSGGTLRTNSGGKIELRGVARLSDLSIVGTVDLDFDSSQTILGGEIDNQGTINIGDKSADGIDPDLTTESSAMLQGGGTVNLTGPNSRISRLDPFSGSGVITNVDNTIQGTGVIRTSRFFQIINETNGTISANRDGHILHLNTSDGVTSIPTRILENRGTINANSGGQLLIGSTVDSGFLGLGLIDNSGGEIVAEDASIVSIGSANITGGSLRSAGTGKIQIGGSTNLDSIDLEGMIENTSDLVIGDAFGSTPGQIGISGPTSLGGGGRLRLNDGIIKGASSATSILTNLDNTITDNGQIGDGQLTFVNEQGGSLIAESAQILAISSTTTNRGKFQVDFAGRIEIEGDITNAAAGSLVGNGTIESAEPIMNDGRIAPGASVGELTVEASIEFSASSLLEIEIDHTGADLLTVLQGDVLLDGGLQINLLSGFTPLASDVFDILLVIPTVTHPGPGSLSGTFAGIDNGDSVFTQDDRGSFIVNYDYTAVGRVWLSNFTAVPEPSSTIPLGVLALITASRRRRTRRKVSFLAKSRRLFFCPQSTS